MKYSRTHYRRRLLRRWYLSHRLRWNTGKKTLAAGGAIQLAPGRVRLWLHTVPGAEQFPVHIFRAALRFTEIALSENYRVECICADNLSARVAKMLSYQQDAIIRNYKPGCDARIFSIVR
ncbi:Uncharacterised protein [Klebsiella pneumoniae]|nr:Uncharacterised protein [Klebsiella pneumoniae]